MKAHKHLIVLLVAVFMLGAGTVKAQSNDLKYLVQALNEQMPMSLGMTGDMTKAAINDGCLEFTAIVDESIINIDALKANPELLKENIQQMFLNRDENMNILMEELIPAGLGIKLTYIGRASGNKVSAMLNSDELKKLSNSGSDKKNPDALLDAQLRITNAQLPNDLGNGMVNTKMVREGNYVVYYYICDEDQYDIDQMNEYIPLMKDFIIDDINDNGDPTFALLRQMCKNANVGIAFTYVGKTSGKKATIRIPVDKLK